MIEKILGSIITFVVSGSLGYCVNIIRSYKKRDKSQEEALKCLLRSSITSKYYIYTELQKIPQYEKQNINYLAEAYYSMGGNSYIKEIVAELNKLPIR